MCYILANYDRWWKYPKMFNDFKSAFMMHQLYYDINNVIEEFNFDTNTSTVVWSKEYE